MPTTSYQLKRGDSERALAELARRNETGAKDVRLSRKLLTRVIVSAGVALVLIPLIAVLSTRGPIHGWQVFYLVLTSFALGVILAGVSQEERWKTLAHLAAPTEEAITVNLTEEGIELQSDISTTFFPWGAKTEVLAGYEFIFLCSGHMCVFVPVASFADSAQINEFVSYARERLQPLTTHQPKEL